MDLILCSSGHAFPLFNKTYPNLLPHAALKKDAVGINNLETSKKFSAQWSMWDKKSTIWGWDRDRMKDFFYKNIHRQANELKDKVVIDLGCGHGIYSTIMAEAGCQTTAFDISDGFLKLAPTLTDEIKSRIFFIQGDISNLPLKENQFDLVWSCGVLHHTPNTKDSFMKATRIVKEGGRLYVWLYKPVYYTKILTFIRLFTTRMPDAILLPICYLTAPLFAATKYILTKLNINYRSFEKKTLRENALSIHDTIAPPYRWHHSKDEVSQWFQEANFCNITVTDESSLGFGMLGDKVRN